MKGGRDELQLLLRSRFPILVVESSEERRVFGTMLTWMAERRSASA